ncbi:MAG: ASKHA domain-containing protein [Candidatus Methanomethylicia archaeon]
MHYLNVSFEPEGKRVKVKYGSTIFNAAMEAGIRIRSECGGIGFCGKCKVVVKDVNAVSGLNDIERRFLSEFEIHEGYRLACQTEVLNDVTVFIPHESFIGFLKMEISGIERSINLNPLIKKFYLRLFKPSLIDAKPDFERLQESLINVIGRRVIFDIDYEVLKVLPEVLRSADWNVTTTLWGDNRIISVEAGDTSREIYGFAVDIGTSKIVGHLVNLVNGETIAIGGIENPQMIYGEDVLSRVSYASINIENLKDLQKLVIDGINRVLFELCDKVNVNPNRIYEVVIVGNTVMHHLFLGVTPKYLALSPYTPVFKRSINLVAKDLNLNINPTGVITVLPIIAGFVGSDAIADVLATGIHKLDENSLLIDIGTNTEIFIGNRSDLICCSCASGPAFEGMHIKYGMRAVEGAIEKVTIDSNLDVEYKVIGDIKPKGICGSATIDIIAGLFKNGVIDRFGKFNVDIRSRRIKRSSEGFEFIIAFSDETSIGRDIVFSQRDIREIQLAKAAIYSGCYILMKKKNLGLDDINRVFIAGAFGNYIDVENAKIIGLIPDIPSDKVKFVGNTAIVGAKMALLSSEVRSEAESLANIIRYHELAADPNFQMEFLNSIPIPHKELDRFPNVKKLLNL